MRKRTVASLCQLFFALAFMLGGILGGLYVGIWLCMAGGIIQFIHGLQAVPVAASDVAWGIVRFLIAPVGWLVFLFGVAIGKGIADL